jgi:hypothetical protein
MNDEPNNNPKLGEAMRGLEKEGIFVPASKDEEVLGEIRKHFGEVGPEIKVEEAGVVFGTPKIRRVRRPKAWYRWLPLAASVGIAGLILYFSMPNKRERADVNRDGAVDVIDALVLAEQVRDGKGQDVNGDGKVDERDAGEIVARVVDLERSGS